MILPVRSLMQVHARSFDEDDWINLGIVSVAVLATIIALAVLACLYDNWKKQQFEDQKRKYANWTERDGILPEFYQQSVKPSRKNPLNLAIEMKNLPLVKALVGQQIQSCGSLDGLGRTALYYASGTGSKKIVGYIADYTPANLRLKGIIDSRILRYLLHRFPELQEFQTEEFCIPMEPMEQKLLEV